MANTYHSVLVTKARAWAAVAAAGAVLGACTALLGIDGEWGDQTTATGGGGGAAGQQPGGAGGTGNTGNTGDAGGMAGAGGGTGGCAPANVAQGKPSMASTSQSGHPPSDGNDSDTTTTRWCASARHVPETWQVDLQAPFDLVGTQITWEFEQAYGYFLEISNDGAAWTEVVDQRDNSLETQLQQDSFTAAARYVRITVTRLPPVSAQSEFWPSFYDFQVLGCAP